MKPLPILLAAIVSLTALPSANAEESPPPKRPPTPEQVQQVMQNSLRATMSAMVDSAGPLAEASINAQMVMAANPETAERLAAFKKNFYDALVKKGFTPAQSFQIMLSTSPPSASGLSK
jgi:hypothetical protein